MKIQKIKILDEELYKPKVEQIIFQSTIIQQTSMYNNNENIEKSYINSILTQRQGKFYIFEHYFIWFKDYFQHYLKTVYTLFKDDEFLPVTWRYYIAIMAASTMRCQYLYRILEENFIEAGGDESWLIYGLDIVPDKIVRLGRINNILAHQPWILLPDDIKV